METLRLTHSGLSPVVSSPLVGIHKGWSTGLNLSALPEGYCSLANPHFFSLFLTNGFLTKLFMAATRLFGFLCCWPIGEVSFYTQIWEGVLPISSSFS